MLFTFAPGDRAVKMPRGVALALSGRYVLLQVHYTLHADAHARADAHTWADVHARAPTSPASRPHDAGSARHRQNASSSSSEGSGENSPTSAQGIILPPVPTKLELVMLIRPMPSPAFLHLPTLPLAGADNARARDAQPAEMGARRAAASAQAGTLL